MPIDPIPDAPLAAALAALGRRLRALRMARGAVAGLWPGLGVAGVWVLAGKLALVADPVPGRLLPLVAVVLGGSALGALAGALKPLPGVEDSALLLDRLLGTDEAAATAVGLEGGAAPADLVAALHERLDQDVDPADPRLLAGLPFRSPRRTRLLPVLLALVVGAAFLPPLRAPARHAPSHDAAAEADRLVERKEALERELGAELPADVDQAFDDLIAALRKGDAGRAEAERKAERLDEALEGMKKGEGEGVAGEMERAQDALEGVDVEAAEDLRDAAREGDLASAADAVERMRERMKKREPREQERAADALKKAAEAASKAGADELADALKNEAERTSGGGSNPQSGDGGGESQPANGPSGAPGEGGSEPQGGPEGGEQRPGDGLAEYLRALEKQGLGQSLGEAKTRQEMASRLQGAMEAAGANPYEAGPGDGRTGRGGRSDGTADWGAGSTHTDEDQGSRPEGGEHELMNRQVDGVHRDWLTEYGQDHAEKRLEGIQAVTQTVDVPIGDGPVDVEFMRRTGSDERSGKALVQAPEGYRAAADEAIDGEGVPRIYREQVKTYFDAIE